MSDPPTDSERYRRANDNTSPGLHAEEDVDEFFHILSNWRRRAILRYLIDQTDPVDMRDLAEQIAAWENEIPVAALRSDDRQAVYIALYQTHLPTLADYGSINYNQSRGIVERTDTADRFTPYLQMTQHADSMPETQHETHDEIPTTDVSTIKTLLNGQIASIPVHLSLVESALLLALGPMVVATATLKLVPAVLLLVVSWIVVSVVVIRDLADTDRSQV